MQVVKRLPTDAKPRIVRLIEELLVEARKGNVTGIIVFTEHPDGSFDHHRDGMADNAVCFAMRLIERRMLEKYE